MKVPSGKRGGGSGAPGEWLCRNAASHSVSMAGSCRRLSWQKAERLHEYFIRKAMWCAAENIWLESLETPALCRKQEL